MSVERALLYITTDTGTAAEARQGALAGRTMTVPEAQAEAQGIEAFMHSYEPVAAYAWLREARNPMIGERRAADVPFNPAAKRAGGVYPAGRTRANKLRLLGILAITEDTTVAVARERLTAASQNAWSPMDSSDAETMRDLLALPATTAVRFAQLAPETPPEWERIAAVIDALPRDAQPAVIAAAVASFTKFLRSINVCYSAIEPLRRVAERLWGYFAFDSDAYMQGMSSSVIRDYYAPYSPAPYVVGGWRRRGVAIQQATWGARASTWGPGDVLFGSEARFNSESIGCRSGDSSVVNPVNSDTCVAPTGETHRVWFQYNGRATGGWSPTPAVVLRATDGGDFYDRASPVDPNGDFYMVHGANPEWRAPFFNARKNVTGKSRLWMVPPLEWYWRMYFAPQPEFGGRSFAEWVLAMSPSEFVRTMRRSNTMRNIRMAGQYNTLIESLAGSAQVDAARRALTRERENLANVQLVQGAGGAAAAAVAGIPVAGPVVALVIGAVTTATIALMSALQPSGAVVNVDVFGAMCPAFSPFAIQQTRASFAVAYAQTIGMPARPQLAFGLLAFGLLGIGLPVLQPGSTQTQTQTYQLTPDAPAVMVPSSGLPPGAKVGLGALVLAVLVGGGYYLATRKPRHRAKPNRALRRKARARAHTRRGR